jgi:hypothetical protein
MTWSESLHEWYFDEAGGMFLSDDARVVYHEVLEVIAVAANAGKQEDKLTEPELERLRRAGQALRRQLAADIGSADSPRLHGIRPAVTPPATTRLAS